MAITLSGNGTSTFSNNITSSTGNLTLGDGNLVVADGHGIDFSATGNGSGTMSGELLADYEEGTWTPVVVTGTPTYNGATGSYVKIGKIVHIRFYISSGAGGSIAIPKGVVWEGLPYIPSGNVSGAIWETANPALAASDPGFVNIFSMTDGRIRTQSAYTQGFTNTGNNGSNMSAILSYITT